MDILETLSHIDIQQQAQHIFSLLSSSITGYLALLLLFIAAVVNAHIRNFIKDIIGHHMERWLDALGSIVKYEQHHYKRLAAKFLRPSHTGGLKDSYLYPSLSDIYINILCGKVSTHIVGSSSLVDSLSEIPITHKNDVLSTLYDTPKTHSLILLGGPGAGKTTLFSHLLKSLLTDKHNITPIPLIVRELEEYFRDKPHQSFTLTDLIDLYFGAYVVESNREKLPLKWLTRRLIKGKCLIFVDGVDEMESESSRANFITWLKRETRRYSNNKFLITSRPNGIKKEAIEHSIERYMCPLSTEQIQSFVNEWYEEVARCEIKKLEKPDQEEEIAIRHRNKLKCEGVIHRINETKVLRELARKPMILSMMLTVHMTGNTLPERRCSLFDRVMTVMLGARNESKSIRQKFSPEVKKDLLSVIAFHMVSLKQKEISIEQIIKILKKADGNHGISLNLDNFIWEVINHSGLLISTKKNIYTFCHQSFRDYLCACYIHDRPDQFHTKKIIKMARDSDWLEPLLLLIGQRDATKIVDQIIQYRNRIDISFLIFTLDEAKSITSETRTAATEYIQHLAESENIETQALIGKALLNKRIAELSADQDIVFDSSSITQIELLYFLLLTDEGVLIPHQERLLNQNINLTTKPARCSKSVAESFCEWISRSQGDGWIYRLPSTKDIPQVTEKYSSFWLDDVILSRSHEYYGAGYATTSKQSIIQRFKEKLQDDTLFIRRCILRTNFSSHQISIDLAKSRSDTFDQAFHSLCSGITSRRNEIFQEFQNRSRLTHKIKQNALHIGSAICAKLLPPENFKQMMKTMDFNNQSDLNHFDELPPNEKSRLNSLAKGFSKDLEQCLEHHMFDIVCGKNPIENQAYFERSIGSIGLVLHKNFLDILKIEAPNSHQGDQRAASYPYNILLRAIILQAYFYGEKDISRLALALYINLCIFDGKQPASIHLSSLEFEISIAKDSIPLAERFS